MTIPEASLPEIPRTLVEHVQNKAIIPFIGSGASLGIKKNLFPTWSQVLEEMQNRLAQEAKKTEAEIVSLYLKENRLLDAAKEALRGLGLNDFYAVMRELFQKSHEPDFDLSLQQSIWRLNSHLVITTNYDHALEWANSNATPLLNRQAHDLLGLLNVHSQPNPRVWHLHGDIHDLESLILAPNQYGDFYAGNKAAEYEAARKQLDAVVSNFPLLFVGFGFNDEYVMKMLEEAFNTFKANSIKSFALVKRGTKLPRNLWGKLSVQIIEYEDHGPPLLQLLEKIVSNFQPMQSQSTPKKTTATRNDDNTSFPNCTVNTIALSVTGLQQVISVLEDNFAFRWERDAFRETSNPMVYWPVRLREPSAIHAVQAFAAAALQNTGASVVLCLDDLGEQKYDPQRFKNRIDGWFSRVAADQGRISLRLFSEILRTRDSNEAWYHVQKWLGGQSYSLKHVLEICKLYNSGMTPEDFLSRGTGRLLTPGVVWACLKHLIDESPGTPFMTLGGHDEQRLWQAWRERINQGSTTVSHLYIPELSNTHMETTDLKWKAKSDIQRTMVHKLDALSGNLNWQSANEIIKWSITGCVFLPKFVYANFAEASTLQIETNAEPNSLISPAVTQISEWVL